MTYRKNIRVLIVEPSNQHPRHEKARPNGSLGPAYLVGALRREGIEADYLDVTVGPKGSDVNKTFFKRVKMENGNIRCGMSSDELPEIFAQYDVVATSSIFTVQTRMHFEIAAIAKKVMRENKKLILTVSGGVNARSLREHFLSNGFDIIGLGDGENTIVQIVNELSSGKPDYSKVERIAYRKDGKTIITPGHYRKASKFIDDVPQPALDSLPLDLYQKIGIPHSGNPIPGTKFVSMQTARGCQDKCTFCHISQEKEERDLVGNIGFLRMFSNERVSADVTQAVNLGINRLYIEDDNMFFNKKRLFQLAPHLKREGLTYSNVSGANLRFMVKKEGNRYVVDKDFVQMLADFGLDEFSLPFETKSKEMMEKYATGKYDPDEMDPLGILRELKKVGIKATSNFLIGFRDETWESILRTKEFAKELFAEGLDSAGFAIPVPYPGTLDFEHEMKNPDLRKKFNENLLDYTDQMHTRGLPLFGTKVPGEKLRESVKEFWLELNSSDHVKASKSVNVEQSLTH